MLYCKNSCIEAVYGTQSKCAAYIEACLPLRMHAFVLFCVCTCTLCMPVNKLTPQGRSCDLWSFLICVLCRLEALIMVMFSHFEYGFDARPLSSSTARGVDCVRGPCQVLNHTMGFLHIRQGWCFLSIHPSINQIISSSATNPSIHPSMCHSVNRWSLHILVIVDCFDLYHACVSTCVFPSVCFPFSVLALYLCLRHWLFKKEKKSIFFFRFYSACACTQTHTPTHWRRHTHTHTQAHSKKQTHTHTHTHTNT